jgi:hypothetical protein
MISYLVGFLSLTAERTAPAVRVLGAGVAPARSWLACGW